MLWVFLGLFLSSAVAQHSFCLLESPHYFKYIDAEIHIEYDARTNRSHFKVLNIDKEQICSLHLDSFEVNFLSSETLSSGIWQVPPFDSVMICCKHSESDQVSMTRYIMNQQDDVDDIPSRIALSAEIIDGPDSPFEIEIDYQEQEQEQESSMLAKGKVASNWKYLQINSGSCMTTVALPPRTDSSSSSSVSVVMPCLKPGEQASLTFFLWSGLQLYDMKQAAALIVGYWQQHACMSFNASGDGLSSAQVGRTSSFVVSVPHHFPDLDADCVVAFLEGPSLIAATTSMLTNDSIKVEYFIYDEGEYELTVWWIFSHDVLDHNFPADTCPITRCIISHSKVTAELNPAAQSWLLSTIAPYVDVPYCTREEALVAEGRWLSRVLPMAERCSMLYFSGADNWVWCPVHCQLRYYQGQDLRDCLLKKQANMTIIGSSLQRTTFYSIVKMLSPKGATGIDFSEKHKAFMTFDDPLVPLKIDFHWVFSNFYKKERNALGSMYNVTQALEQLPNTHVVLWGPGPGEHWSLASSTSILEESVWWTGEHLSRFSDLIVRGLEQVHAVGVNTCFYNKFGINPQVSRKANRVWTEAIRKVGYRLLETHKVSAAAFEMTLDGFHWYSAINRDFAGNMMNQVVTQMFLNSICTQ